MGNLYFKLAGLFTDYHVRAHRLSSLEPRDYRVVFFIQKDAGEKLRRLTSKVLLIGKVLAK